MPDLARACRSFAPLRGMSARAAVAAALDGAGPADAAEVAARPSLQHRKTDGTRDPQPHG